MYRFIGKQFRRPSGILGTIISNIMIKGNSPDYDKLIPELDIRPGDSILEIGYGHGLGVHRLSSGYDCLVSGIDFSELMYNMATRRNREHIDRKKVALYYGDFLTSEKIPGPYDKIFLIHVIYFWDSLDEPFSLISKKLKEGGLLCMFMAHTDFIRKMKFTKDGIFNKYSIDHVVDRLNYAGFREVHNTLDKKGYIIKCRK